MLSGKSESENERIRKPTDQREKYIFYGFAGSAKVLIWRLANWVLVVNRVHCMQTLLDHRPGKTDSQRDEQVTVVLVRCQWLWVSQRLCC